MPDTTDSRREFLRRLLSITVVSSVAPSLALGRLVPSLKETDAGQLLGSYQIRLTEYPELADVGGSVKLVRDEQLLLNPEHIEWLEPSLRAETNGFSCKRGWYPIAVTRVKESGADAFTAVSTLCPHEAEYQVSFDPLRFQFLCCHQFSSFRPDGTWIPPSDPEAADPSAPSSGRVTNGLTRFPADFDLVDTITIGGVTFGVDELRNIESTVVLEQNHPNPCRLSTEISFLLPGSTHVRLIVTASDGKEVACPVDTLMREGAHRIVLPTDTLPSGLYVYRIQTRFGERVRRMVVQH